jgi:hypothetical protein
MLLIFSIVAMGNGLMFISEASVSSQAECFYGITEDRILVLTTIFYIGYIPVVPFALWLLTRPNGLWWAVAGGGVSLAAGAALRSLAREPRQNSFVWMEGGTAVLSVSTPLLLGCLTKVAANCTVRRAVPFFCSPCPQSPFPAVQHYGGHTC